MARKLSTTMDERFWPKVNPTGFCWEWTASISPAGYGRINNGIRPISAHRVAYELLVGPIPEGLVLDHLCRVRHCVNPDHLDPVTQIENMHRSTKALRTHCPKGHMFDPAAKRTADGARVCKPCARANQQRVFGYTPRVPWAERSQCKRGHSLEGDNLYLVPGKRGRCRACGRESANASARRKRERLAAAKKEASNA